MKGVLAEYTICAGIAVIGVLLALGLVIGRGFVEDRNMRSALLIPACIALFISLCCGGNALNLWLAPEMAALHKLSDLIPTPAE